MSFTAIGAMLKIVPSWCYWILALAALCLGCELHGRHTVQGKWDAYVVAEKLAAGEAITKRAEDNARMVTIQSAVSNNIQKVHDNELTKVRSDLAAAQRMRVGAAICSGVAGSTEAGGAGGSNGTDPTGRLLPEGLDRDIRALILETEEVAGTGRAAQAFIRANGMAE